MATITLTYAEYTAAAKPFSAEDEVILADAGQNIDGLTLAQLAELGANGVDVIDATNDSMFLSTSQYEALVAVRLTAADTIVLADTGAELGTGTIEQISGLLARNVDRIDVADNVLPFSLAQLNALQVPLSPSDVVVLTDHGSTIGSLAPHQFGELASRGVVGFDATNNAISFTEAQFASLGAMTLSWGDVITRAGTPGSDTIVGTAFNDILDGGSGNDTLWSGVGAHSLKGGKGNDRLNDGADNDKLYGGHGKDVMSGGKGKDAFVFDRKPNKKTNLDTIKSYNVRDDSVYLDNAVFKKLGKGSETKPGKLKSAFFTVGSEAKDKNDYLFYNKKNGIFYYDADGSGSGRAVEIAKLDKNLKMSAKEFFIV
ncbi:calcium-binding protein [Microvirga sp. GCM10011540]|uniref:calcium-binding protein n=1 Tax=Microvirga sp. GCM10011540 TaxID=3317338 RepID=UPI00360CFC1E